MAVDAGTKPAPDGSEAAAQAATTATVQRPRLRLRPTFPSRRCSPASQPPRAALAHQVSESMLLPPRVNASAFELREAGPMIEMGRESEEDVFAQAPAVLSTPSYRCQPLSNKLLCLSQTR